MYLTPEDWDQIAMLLGQKFATLEDREAVRQALREEWIEESQRYDQLERELRESQRQVRLLFHLNHYFEDLVEDWHPAERP